ncbi:MAG: hypothetical protein NT082_03285 [Chloroflexi bacterium]|nr:hypothetical protein [Chloroflexota bacterium]
MDDTGNKTGEIITISKSPLITSYTKAREQGSLLVKKYRFSGITSILLAPLIAVGLVFFLLIMFILLFAIGIYFTVRFMLSLPQSSSNSSPVIKKRVHSVQKEVGIR